MCSPLDIFCLSEFHNCSLLRFVFFKKLKYILDLHKRQPVLSFLFRLLSHKTGADSRTCHKLREREKKNKVAAKCMMKLLAPLLASERLISYSSSASFSLWHTTEEKLQQIKGVDQVLVKGFWFMIYWDMYVSIEIWLFFASLCRTAGQ